MDAREGEGLQEVKLPMIKKKYKEYDNKVI